MQHKIIKSLMLGTLMIATPITIITTISAKPNHQSHPPSNIKMNNKIQRNTQDQFNKKIAFKYEKIGHFITAQSVLQNAILENPDKTHLYLDLARLLRKKYHIAKYKNEEPETIENLKQQALYCFIKNSQIQKKSARAFFELANFYAEIYQIGSQSIEIDKAIENINKAISLFKNNDLFYRIKASFLVKKTPNPDILFNKELALTYHQYLLRNISNQEIFANYGNIKMQNQRLNTFINAKMRNSILSDVIFFTDKLLEELNSIKNQECWTQKFATKNNRIIDNLIYILLDATYKFNELSFSILWSPLSFTYLLSDRNQESGDFLKQQVKMLIDKINDSTKKIANQNDLFVLVNWSDEIDDERKIIKKTGRMLNTHLRKFKDNETLKKLIEEFIKISESYFDLIFDKEKVLTNDIDKNFSKPFEEMDLLLNYNISQKLIK